MTKDLTKLKKDYPEIFNCDYNCGYFFPETWYEIINELCQRIQTYVDVFKIPQVKCVQIKEKFGGLRFYIDQGDPYIYGLIREAEEKSYNTCFFCGDNVNLGFTEGWILVACEKCANENKREWEAKRK